MAARTAAENGVDVIFIEEHKVPGSPVFCGEGLSIGGIKHGGLEAVEPLFFGFEVTNTVRCATVCIWTVEFVCAREAELILTAGVWAEGWCVTFIGNVADVEFVAGVAYVHGGFEMTEVGHARG